MKKRNTKRSLINSVISLVLCLAMLMGTTFAWFTDSVSSGVNKIQAGNLDVELYHESKNVPQEKVTESTENLFKDIALWEPGAYAYETFTVKNEGTLALKYKMAINVCGFTSYNGHNLTEVLKVKVVETAPTERPIYTDGVTLKDWTYGDGAVDNTLYPIANPADPAKPSEKNFTVVVYWQPTDHDNDFNMNNGRPSPLTVDLGVELVATQLEAENDSFGTDYDRDAVNQLPPVEKIENAMASATVSESGSAIMNARAVPATQSEIKETIVEFENGALEAGKTAELSVNTTNTLFNVSATNDVQVASIDLTLTVGGQPVTHFNDKSAKITTYISTGLSDVKVTYTHSNGDVETINENSYDPNTGKLVFKTNHFSTYGASGRAVAYNLAADKGYAPVIDTNATEDQQEEAIDAAYQAAAQDAANGNVTLANDADMEKASQAAKKNNAGFQLPEDVTTENNENWIAKNGTLHYATIQNAINAAKDGDEIIVLKNVETQSMPINLDPDEYKKITVNLNGNTITSSAGKVVQVVGENSNLTLVNGTIIHTGTGEAVFISGNNPSLTLKDLTIKSADLSLLSEGIHSTIIIENCDITYNYFGIYQNGLYGGNNISITKSTITDNSEESVGIYVSGNKNIDLQNLTVTDSVITGETAIEVKHTNVNIFSTTLNATQENVAYNKNEANGSATVGYCLAITSNGSADQTRGSVTLSGNIYNPANPGCDVFNASAASGVNHGATVDGYNNAHILSPDKLLPVCRIDGTDTVFYSAYDLRDATAAALKNKTVVLQSDEVLSDEVYLSGKTFTLDLNGHSLELVYGEGVNPNNGSVLYVAAKNSKLTIKDSSEAQTGAIYGSDQTYSNKVTSAVRVGNYGKLIINGGHFYGRSAGTSCIFVCTSRASSAYASVTINGGKFETASPSGGVYYVLNHEDKATAGCKITVNGGRFKNYNPGVTMVDPVNAYTGKIVLGTGCSTTAETVGADTWYTVSK